MYRGRLGRDFDLWVDKGLLGRPVADALLAEYDARRSAFSVGNVLLILAAALVASAILLLVAANWDAIPRLVRVIGIFAMIWLFNGAAAWALAHGRDRLGGAFLLLAAASFGGAISLVGQLYHLSGDTVDAMLLWFAMTAIAALAFRSGVLTVVAGFLSWTVFVLFVSEVGDRWSPFYGWSPPVMAVIVVLLLRWSDTPRAQHLVYCLLLAWIGWLYTLYGGVDLAWLFAGVGALLFTAVTLKGSPLAPIARQRGAAPAFYTFVFSLLGIALLHGHLDEGRGLALVAVVTLALSVLGLSLDGRDNGAVRYLAYLTFAGEILYLSFVTIDSIIGTSGFFLVSGLVVAVLAVIVMRMEKLFARRNAPEVGQ